MFNVVVIHYGRPAPLRRYRERQHWPNSHVPLPRIGYFFFPRGTGPLTYPGREEEERSSLIITKTT